MERPPRIVAVAGSLRKGSFNRRLLRYAVDGARAAGATVEELGPEWLALPLYNADLEHDGRFPEPVEAWRAKLRACEGLLIASPEYNHGISGVLKNAIDWAARTPSTLAGKVAVSFGASPGAQGTARSQLMLRTTLSAVNVWMLPRTVLIASAREAFDEGGNLKDARRIEDLAALGTALVAAIRAQVGRI